MKKFTLWTFVCLFALHTGIAYAQVDVLMQHNNIKRTGWNDQETILNTSNVKNGTFGRIFSCTVDDQVYAQPLVVTNVSLAQGTKNVVYVATVNNTVYAFDADNGTLYWQRNFTPPGLRPPVNKDIHANICLGGYNDFSGNFGIVGTPVIDKSSNTMYFVSRDVDPSQIDVGPHSDVTTYTSTGFFMKLHAIDISTGNDKKAPALITASVNSTAPSAIGGKIFLDPRRNNQRGGLVLSNGIVYITFAAHCDWDNYHGWIVGYDVTKGTFSATPDIVYSSTPNSSEGGIWMSGAAPAVDDNGNLYVASGNGGSNAANFDDRGESVIKLTPNVLNHTATSLAIADYFTPHDYAYLNSHDYDLASQIMLIPNTNLAVTAVKSGFIYVMNTASLGGFSSTSDNLVQPPIFITNAPENHASFAYFGGNAAQYFYQYGEGSKLTAYPIQNGKLGTPVINTVMSDGPTGQSGSYMSVSSHLGDPATGILWTSQAVSNCNANQNSCPGVFKAMDASDITKQLWNSTVNPDDNIEIFAKTVCPTIANGKVYIPSNGSTKKLIVYGLAQNDPCPGLLNVALQVNNSGALYSANNNNFTITPTNDNANAVKAFDGNVATGWHGTGDNNPPGNYTFVQVNLGKKYDICKVTLHFGNANTQNYKIEGSTDGTTFTLLEQITNNGFADHTLLLNNQTYQWIRVTPQNRYDFQVDCIVNEMEVYGVVNNPCASPTGFSWSNSSETDGTLGWQAVAGATSYNIQYKTHNITSWRTASSNTPSIALHALSCSYTYDYQVQAVCATGPSNPASNSFDNRICSAPCGLFTRYDHADIGEIGFAGSSCYVGVDQFINHGTFTIKGSGADIGGNNDAFQFAFINLNGDEEIFARVSAFAAGDPSSSKGGLMMRDVMSNTSRFAFIGITKGNGAVFSYRSAEAPAGSTTTIPVPGISTPYWVKLRKLGTQYSAFISPTGVSNSWTQVGSTQNLNFGSTGSINVGLAASSADNSSLTTVTIDNFNGGSGTPLPITLLDFKAANVNNDYIELRWSTSMEQNNDHFEIERSTDGTNFGRIANVNAVGNSNTIQYYSTEDNNPAEGINYYRLRQVDRDGKSSYSYIVIVKFGKQTDPLVYPNPVSTYFSVVAGIETIKEISLYNATGQTLQYITNNTGYSSFKISMANLTSGVYTIIIKTASHTYQKKIIKQ